MSARRLLDCLLDRVKTLLRPRTRQPMTSGLAMLAHWSVRQKLNRVSSVQLRRTVRALSQ